jgi:hypothetical protein
MSAIPCTTFYRVVRLERLHPVLARVLHSGGCCTCHDPKVCGCCTVFESCVCTTLFGGCRTLVLRVPHLHLRLYECCTSLFGGCCNCLASAMHLLAQPSFGDAQLVGEATESAAHMLHSRPVQTLFGGAAYGCCTCCTLFMSAAPDAPLFVRWHLFGGLHPLVWRRPHMLHPVL